MCLAWGIVHWAHMTPPSSSASKGSHVGSGGSRAEPFSHVESLGPLAGALERAGYVPQLFTKVPAIGMTGWSERMREALGGVPEAAREVLRLFALRDAMTRTEVDAALGGFANGCDVLVRAGLLEREGERVRSVVTLTPAANLLCACDPIPDPPTKDIPEDFVLGVGNATRIVDDLCVRARCGVAVDMGCGQGFLSLRAREHADRVIGTDISPRALAFARLNEAINSMGSAKAGGTGGARAVEWRTGSFFEPLTDVRGQIGSLASNPPFIIAPESAHATTALTGGGGKGGSHADAFEHVLREAPSHLGNGGWATIVGLWHHGAKQDWSEPVRAWLGDAQCDALIMHFESMTPPVYRKRWLMDTSNDPGEVAWAQYCEERQIGAITFGGVVLRKRTDAKVWLRTQALNVHQRSGSASEQLQRIFRVQTTMTSFVSPAALLDLRFRGVAGVRYVKASNDPEGRNPLLVQTQGLTLPLPCGADVMAVLQAMDGSRPARSVLNDLHKQRKLPVDATNPNAARTLQALALHGYVDVE
jgi:SAM-dependent methyltransferase